MPDGITLPTLIANRNIPVTEDLEPDGKHPVAIIGGHPLAREEAVELRDWLDTFLCERGGGVRTPADGVSMAEAARRVGVHYRTIRNWVQKGQLPATRFGPSGKIIRIDPADLARVRRPA